MKTLFVGQSLLHLKTIDSTNSYAQELLKVANVHEGTIIKADEQTAGRGQRGNNWYSQPGLNLTFSLVLHPNFIAAKNQFFLNKIVTLGIRNFLETKLKSSIYIKWPNDIYVENKKICGILIENSLKGNKIESSVIGIGLNVNQDVFTDSLTQATSLKLENGLDYSLDDCLEELAKYLEASYLKAKRDNRYIDDEFYKAMYRLEEFHDYSIGNKKLRLKITGVDSIGRLCTISESGEEQFFNFKEISFMP